MSTNKESREQLIQRVTPLLSDRELYAFTSFQNSQQAPLAPSLNAKLFQLFLNGKTCEEIRRLNPAMSLGQIVAARVEGDWDSRLFDHLNHLLDATSQRIQQSTLETADFVCDLLAVANREHGDRARRYLQTGDEKELGDFKIDSIFSLKQAIEVLQKLTGQDRQQTVKHQGEVLHTAVSIPAANKAPSPTEAANVLKLLLPEKKTG